MPWSRTVSVTVSSSPRSETATSPPRRRTSPRCRAGRRCSGSARGGGPGRSRSRSRRARSRPPGAPTGRRPTRSPPASARPGRAWRCRSGRAESATRDSSARSWARAVSRAVLRTIGSHRAARVLGQLHALEQLEVAGDEGERVLQLAGHRLDQPASEGVQLAQLGHGSALALTGPRVEDRLSEVVGDLERGRALVVGPAGSIGVAVHGQQSQELGAGADRHHHHLAQTARDDVRRQLVAEVLVDVLVAPDAGRGRR